MVTSIKYGVICGLLFCFWMISEYLLGLHNEHFDIGQYTEALALLIPVITIYLGLKEKRNLSPSKATYMKLLGTGVFMADISAVIIGSFFIMYNRFINPEWQETIFAKEAEKILANSTSIEDMAAAADNYHFYSKDSTQFLLVFTVVFLTGFVLALFYSFLLRRKNTLR